MRSLIALAVLVALLVTAVAHPRAQRGAGPGDWPHHGGDAGSTRYSPLDQITAANVASLRIAWRRPGVDPAIRAAHPNVIVPTNFRATPLKAGDLLFASNALGLAEAFDPATGATVWAQAVEADDLSGAGASRNLAYWTAAKARGCSMCAAATCMRSTPAPDALPAASARADGSTSSPAWAPRPPRSAGARPDRSSSATWS